MLDPLDEALDTAASTAFRFDPAVGDANLATVEATTQGIRTGIRIAPSGGSYTLASSSSPLLLTLQNDVNKAALHAQAVVAGARQCVHGHPVKPGERVCAACGGAPAA